MDKFTVENHRSSLRVKKIMISQAVIHQFFDKVFEKWDLMSIEYKPFLRFQVARILDELCDNQLSHCLKEIIHNRQQGAFVLDAQYDNTAIDKETEGMRYVVLSTAISHLIGRPNFDAMYGKFYARFAVENTDSSDSYLRKSWKKLELHNDGTYVEERTDFVLMMKIQEQNVQGGESLLLHLDDWKDLSKFVDHSMANEDIVWSAPKSKNTSGFIKRPVFFEYDDAGKPHMLYIDQFAQPTNLEQANYLYQMSESIENSTDVVAVPLPVGSMLVIHNFSWLHGRDKFANHPHLYRELLRQRGSFTH